MAAGPPALSTSPAALPHFPARDPSGFIPPGQRGCCEHGRGSQLPSSASPMQQDKAAAALTFVWSNKKEEEAFFTQVI